MQVNGSSKETEIEKLDKNLLRYLTVKVKKFDLDTDYFKKNIDDKEVDRKIKK